jgi:hypothetical protein
MKLYPFRDAVEMAHKLLNNPRTKGDVEVYQQWMCVGCGSKETMPDPNTFYTEGRCGQCDRPSNIEADGCNFAIVTGDNFAIEPKRPRRSQKSNSPSPSPTDQSP